MAVPPKFAAHRLLFEQPVAKSESIAATTHTLEVYLDYVCPFSAKFFKTLTTKVLPMIRSNPAWASNLAVVFRHQIQPWHPSSTLTHEAGVAVNQVAPDKFWAFSELLFESARDFYDANTVGETRNQTYARLAELAGRVGADKEKVYERLRVSDEPVNGEYNAGNGVTGDLKVLVKMARLVGVHVSPTVVYDGVVQGDVSSSFSEDQWKEWLTKNVV